MSESWVGCETRSRKSCKNVKIDVFNFNSCRMPPCVMCSLFVVQKSYRRKTDAHWLGARTQTVKRHHRRQSNICRWKISVKWLSFKKNNSSVIRLTALAGLCRCVTEHPNSYNVPTALLDHRQQLWRKESMIQKPEMNFTWKHRR